MKISLKFICFCLYLCSTFFLAPFSFVQAQNVLTTQTFKTDFISFKLSNQWGCKLDEAEYVCRPISEVKKRQAIIVIAAKIPGKDDSLKSYFSYLKEPKKMTDLKGRTVASKINLIKYKEVNNTQWVDAIHLSSELEDFYTRYLATVKNGIAILVTYSVDRSKHALYAAELNRMISSIEVLAKTPQIAGPTPKKKEAPKILTGDRKEEPQASPPLSQPLLK